MSDAIDMKPARSYTSKILEEFIALGTPAELARTQNRMVLAAKIYDGMVAKNLTKKQFAELVGKRTYDVTKWLRGDCNFKCDTLSDIQDILDIELLNTNTDVI